MAELHRFIPEEINSEEALKEAARKPLKIMAANAKNHGLQYVEEVLLKMAESAEPRARLRYLYGFGIRGDKPFTAEELAAQGHIIELGEKVVHEVTGTPLHGGPTNKFMEPPGTKIEAFALPAGRVTEDKLRSNHRLPITDPLVRQRLNEIFAVLGADDISDTANEVDVTPPHFFKNDILGRADTQCLDEQTSEYQSRLKQRRTNVHPSLSVLLETYVAYGHGITRNRVKGAVFIRDARNYEKRLTQHAQLSPTYQTAL